LNLEIYLKLQVVSYAVSLVENDIEMAIYLYLFDGGIP